MKAIIPHREYDPGVETVEDEATEKKNNPALILVNDDVNSIEFVVECLMKYCGHTGTQAEQCAMITHHNGKCDVLHGSYEELKPIWEALLDAGLSAQIEI